MKVVISKTFSVTASSQKVWDFMTDVEKVSTCIPGAQYIEDLGEDKHSVLLVVKDGRFFFSGPTGPQRFALVAKNTTYVLLVGGIYCITRNCVCLVAISMQYGSVQSTTKQ